MFSFAKQFVALPKPTINIPTSSENTKDANTTLSTILFYAFYIIKYHNLKLSFHSKYTFLLFQFCIHYLNLYYKYYTNIESIQFRHITQFKHSIELILLFSSVRIRNSENFILLICFKMLGSELLSFSVKKYKNSSLRHPIVGCWEG